MSTFMNRVRSFLMRPDVPQEAPDGTAETLRSGKWAVHPSIPTAAFPAALLLNDVDRALFGRASEQIVLASVRVGPHQVELMLLAPGPQAVGLGLRIPTAANQYKEPYLLMEAEAGNSAEDAVREIHFHLMGRIPDEEIARTDWAGFFRRAGLTLENLRASA